MSRPYQITPYAFQDYIPCTDWTDLEEVLGTYASGNYAGADNSVTVDEEASSRIVSEIVTDARTAIESAKDGEESWRREYGPEAAGTRFHKMEITIEGFTEKKQLGLALLSADMGVLQEHVDRLLSSANGHEFLEKLSSSAVAVANSLSAEPEMDAYEEILARHLGRMRGYNECGVKLLYGEDDNCMFHINVAPLLGALASVLGPLGYDAKSLLSRWMAYDSPKSWEECISIATIDGLTVFFKLMEYGQRFVDERDIWKRPVGEDIWRISGTTLIGVGEFIAGGAELRIAAQFIKPTPPAPLSWMKNKLGADIELDPAKIVAARQLMKRIEAALCKKFRLNMQS